MCSVGLITHTKKILLITPFKSNMTLLITSWQKLSVSLGLLIILLSYYTDRSGNCV